MLYDKDRRRIYAGGGEGGISVFQQKDPDHYTESARITTVKGARTSFFSPELARLSLAVRRQGSQPAAIQIFVSAQWAPGQHFASQVGATQPHFYENASPSSSRIRGDREVNMKWITRKDVKVDRVACPWLIRRFVDPHAEFLFVEEKDLLAESKRQRATPFEAPKIESIKLNQPM